MQDIATLLLNAQSEEEVEKILQNDFFKKGTWKPLGATSGNYGIVENQQANPVAALVEKITNAIDAILLKECKRRGIDPLGEDAPQSMHEAVTDFFGDDEQRRKNRSTLGKMIQIKADGSDSNPNLIIIDKGEGQRPEDFEETFLALLKSKSGKKNIKFVQGRYYMGGSGILPYCGQNGYELIISRSAVLGGAWGWAIVRKNREKEQYEYFYSNIGIPSFDCEKFLDKTDGTIIKLFNYDLPRKSTITTELRDSLDLFIFETFLPYSLEETRPRLASSVTQLYADGNKGKLSNNLELLESRYKMPIVIEADFGKYGKRRIEIYIFKADSELSKSQIRVKRRFTSDEMAVFFTINGQTHSSFGRSFIKTKCKKPELEKDLLVHIDFSGISGADRVDIFPPSRDRMKNTSVTKVIAETLQECIKEDDTLKQLNEARFRKLVEKTGVDFKFVVDFFNRIVQKNPTLLKYLKSGGIIKNPQHPEPILPGEYKPPFYPTFFRIKGWDEERKGVYTRAIPIDSKGVHIAFELNAPDDYFEREISPGSLEVTPGDMVVRRKLMRGNLDLYFKPTGGAKVGETHTTVVMVTRSQNPNLSVSFKVKYLPPIPPALPHPEKEKNPSEPPKISSLGLPEHRLIKKDAWGEKWTGQDIVKIREMDGDKKASDIKICINMDSDDLQDYLIRNRITDEKKQELIKKFYEVGILLYSFVSYLELKTKYGDADGISIDEIVSITMKGISKTLLDLQISEEMLKKLGTE